VDDKEEGGIGGTGGIGRSDILIEDEDDALADPTDAAHDPSVDRVDRRIDGAEDERAVQDEPLEAAADDVPRQRLEVDDNVGKFGDVTS
jgi:hypothetical protein